jgi:hypothetical protein
MFSTISVHADQLAYSQLLGYELTLIALGLLGQLGQVDRVLVTHCEV